MVFTRGNITLKRFTTLIQNYKFSTAPTTQKMKIKFDSSVKGMKELDRGLFKVNIDVPALKVEKHKISDIKSVLKQYTLDTVTLSKNTYELAESDPLHSTHKLIVFDADLFKTPQETLSDDIRQTLETKFKVNLTEDFVKLNVELNYENFKFDDIIKSILPDNLLEENISVKGFSVIGHVAHFNLRNEVAEYKKLIGEVLLDKIKNIKTVVNKVNEIDNTYRNFNLEILAGEPNTLVKTKENACEFTFDFAKVYWNPRLSTEHERVLALLNQNDIVYDVFAGVGPFSVPAAVRKYCLVVANDLNPNSYKYLVENYSNNKSKKSLTKNPFYKTFEQFKAYNLDGNEFIRTQLKNHLYAFVKHVNDNKVDFNAKIFVLMNLPALSIEFLQSFRNLFTHEESAALQNMLQNIKPEKFTLNLVCYTFLRNADELEQLRNRISNDIFGLKLNVDLRFVRKVAPNKDMYCVRFQLGILDLLSVDKASNLDVNEENPCKKLKIEEINKEN